MFTNIVRTEEIQSVYTFYTIKGFDYGTLYYWRLKAKNSHGTSDYSSAYHFKTISASPVVITPVNGAMGISTTPTLSWTPVAGAKSYAVEISLADNFGSYIYRASSIADTNIRPMGLINKTMYYWHVRAYVDTSYTTYSTTYHFSTGE